jgi:hypothetical protein
VKKKLATIPPLYTDDNTPVNDIPSPPYLIFVNAQKQNSATVFAISVWKNIIRKKIRNRKVEPGLLPGIKMVI